MSMEELTGGVTLTMKSEVLLPLYPAVPAHVGEFS